MRRILRVGAVAALVLTGAGCWPVPGHDANRTGWNDLETDITPITVGRLERAWTFTNFGGTEVLDPVVSPDGVHAALGGCGVATVDAATGAGRWVQSFGTCELGPSVMDAGPPFVQGGTVLAAVGWKLDTTPSDRWGWFTRGYGTASGEERANHDGAMIAAVRDGTGLFVDPSVTLSGGPPFQVHGFGPPVTAHIGPMEGLDPPWRRNIRIAAAPSGGGLESVMPTLGQTAFFHAGTGVMVSTPGDTTIGRAVRAYSTTTARPGCPVTSGTATFDVECPLWVTPVDSRVTTSPTIDPGGATLYVGTDAGTVLALDVATGQVRWSASLGAAVSANLSLAEGTLYAPLADGRVAALPAGGCGAPTCASSWESAAGSPITGQPAVAGNLVFTGSADGSVKAYDADGCRPTGGCPPLWSDSLGSAITGAPAVTAGQLYVGTQDGRLVAYRLADAGAG